MPPTSESPGDSSSRVVGTRIGNYEVTRLLGKGSMGEVYQAAHPILDKQVAIKVLSEDLSAYPELVSRFKREARAIARIKHKAIVQAFDFGAMEDGRQYYVMELLKGTNLAVYLSTKGALPWEECLSIALPLLEGLTAAHEAGFIHRDIKPDNIFLTRLEDGTLFPKIIDFGIAKLKNPDEQQDSVITRIDAVMGTPLYMSPEQAPGSTEEVGLWSDIYSTAATLYHMIAGKPPFYSDNPLELMLMHSWQPPPPIYEHRPDLSLEVSDAIMKALAKKPRERYDSMGAFADALRSASDGATIPAKIPLSANPNTEESTDAERSSGGSGQDAETAESPRRSEPGAKDVARDSLPRQRKSAELAVAATMNEVKSPASMEDLHAQADGREEADEVLELEAMEAEPPGSEEAPQGKVISARLSTGTYYAVPQGSKTPYIIAGVVAGALLLGTILFFVLGGAS